jgi:hypothetical protein
MNASVFDGQPTKKGTSMRNPVALAAPRTYAERKQELLSLAQTENGQMRLIFHWNEAHGLPWQAQGPIVATFASIIAGILKKEFRTMRKEMTNHDGIQRHDDDDRKQIV